MGARTPAFPKEYQEEVVTYAFKALNDFSDTFYDGDTLLWGKFKDFFELPIEDFHDQKRVDRIKQKLYDMKGTSDLVTEHKRNESAKVRSVALCIETKPDWGLQSHGDEMLRVWLYTRRTWCSKCV